MTLRKTVAHSSTHSRREKYTQVAAHICQYIHQRGLRTGDRLPTEIEFSQLLHVCPATVHRAMAALAAKGKVVRKRGHGTFVSEEAQANFVRPSEPKGLRVGVLWGSSITETSLRQSDLAEILSGMLDTAHWDAQIDKVDCDPMGSTRAVLDGREGRQIVVLGEPMEELHNRPLFESVLRESFHGIVTVGIWDEPWLRVLLSLAVPIVICDFPNETLVSRADHVTVNPAIGYRQAAFYFVERGCKSLHFCGKLLGPFINRRPKERQALNQLRAAGAIRNPDSMARLLATRTALAHHDLDIPKQGVHWCLDEEIQERARAILSERSNPPDAMICDTLYAADVFARLSAEMDIPIMAAGSAGSARQYDGPAYVIEADLRQMGAIAIAQLLSRLQWRDRPTLEATIPMRFLGSMRAHGITM